MSSTLFPLDSLIIAGSETTASLLTGCIFNICTHPTVKQKLVEEIHTAFTADSEINFDKTANLSYLNAVVEESLRKHPPVVTKVPRIVPPGGAVIDGHWIPGNVEIYPFSLFPVSSNLFDAFSEFPGILTS